MTDYERGYNQGYADAMNWKTQNYLEHFPGRQELMIDCPRCGHCCPQPNQEPVAWMYVNQDGECEQIEYEAPPDDPSVTPLYIIPPQRPWVGLDALENVYKIIIDWDECGGKRSRRELARRIVDLYAAPPQRPWVGLTEIEIVDIEAEELTSASSETFSFARAIEYKLREKNSG
jgi:hypothetical protein